ncbi:MAG: hypothetical protein ACTSQN_15280, partial [Candidatus Heimdallarchaeota archaeon]
MGEVIEEPETACMISSGITICSELTEYMQTVYPEYCDVDLFSSKEKITSQSETVCRELHEIYLNRERYDLHWAFKRANESIIVRQEKISKKIHSKIPSYKEILVNTDKRTKLRVKRTRNIFNFLSILISVIDIAVSVALILLVTFLSQHIESLIESVLLNILFIGLIALAKVSLDRFVIIPQIDRWGWKQYLKSINLMKQITISLMSTGLVLEEAVKRDVDNETLVELFLRGFERRKFTKRINKEYLNNILETY